MACSRSLATMLTAVAMHATIASTPAKAATFTVDNTLDLADGNPGDGVCAATGGGCTLRAAVQEANANAPTLDTVVLPAGTFTLTIAPSAPYGDDNGSLDILDDIEIVGAGPTATVIDGNHLDTILYGAQLTLARETIVVKNLTLQHGGTPANVAGAIFSVSPVRFEDVVVRDNEAAIGAGVYAAGTFIRTVVTGNVAHACCAGIRSSVELVLIDSTVSDNHALNGPAGGIFAYGDIEMTIVRSTISGNTAGERGGGLVYAGEEATIVDSTISGNTAGTHGGGIRRDAIYDVGLGGEPTGPMEIENSTITDNTADLDASGFGDGGGISSPTTGTHLRNSILAGNGDGGGEAPDCAASIESEGHNLVQSTLGCTLGGDLTGNVIGVSAMLAPLADNGGLTATHALLPGSSALDAGNPLIPGTGGHSCSPLDQRGIPRPQPSRCDIGAYEAGSPLCAAPRMDCAPAVARGSSIKMRRKASGGLQISWKWKGIGIDTADFGSPPTTTGYALCVYDTQATVPAAALEALVPAGPCASHPCWRSAATGFSYQNRAGTPSGVLALKLKAKADGKASISLKGVAAPALPLLHDPTTIVQLGRLDGGPCWAARFGTALRNDGETFSAKSD